MKLKDLLGRTAMETILTINVINEKRIERNLIQSLNVKNSYGRILSDAWDEIIKKYGEYEVLRQCINESAELEILLKE